MKKYDIAVIGAGSAGLTAANTAHRRGAKTLMIEKHKIGGECTHSGCVPSKTLLHSAKAYKLIQHADALGLPAPDIRAAFDFAQVMEHVDAVVQSIYDHEKPEVFEKAGIDVRVHPSGATFLDAKTIQVGDEVIHAEHSIVCTGSSPRQIETLGDKALATLDNENFWELRQQPSSLIFIGGGVISAELGQAMARFGTEVTIIDRNARILKALDADVAEAAAEMLRKEGIRIVTEANVICCEQRDDGKIRICLEQHGDQRDIVAESVFVAIGRVPNVAGMDLEKAGVAYNENGIKINQYLQANGDNIYACGDVTTPLKFTHTAGHQATLCVENILKGNHVENDLRIFPWAIFTEPEIAHVGMTEAEAREKLGNVQVFRVNAAIDRFITESKTGGFLKVVFDAEDRVVGADAIGAHSGEWIQLITLAIKNNIPATSINDTIFIYPTFSEMVKKAFSRFLRTKGDY